MDLWIRSQDKRRLVKVTELYVSDETNKNVPGDILNAEFCFVIINDYDGIGRYKTKERALQVLDEIDECMNNATNNGLSVARYVMPLE